MKAKRFNRFLSSMLTLLILLSICPLRVSAVEGAGTSGNPWIIGATESDAVQAVLSEDGKTLTISGTGAMSDFASNVANIPWYSSTHQQSLEALIIENGVTSVAPKAFKYFTKLTSVTLADSVVSIGKDAFYGSSITSIALPENLESLGEQAFYKCSALSGNITIPDHITAIDQYTFADTAITGVECGGNSQLQKIAGSAFANCKSLTNVVLSDKIGIISPGAFSGCTSLSDITLPDNPNFTIISNKVFYGCTSLTEIVIPDSVKTIGESAFDGCTALAKVTLSKQLTAIGRYAFRSTALKSVYVPASVQTLGTNGSNQVFIKLPSDSVIYLNNAAQVNLLRVSISNPSSASNGYTFANTALAVTNGGTFPEGTEFAEGTLATPTKEGSTFGGWYDNSDCLGDAVTSPEAGKTYYAKWIVPEHYEDISSYRASGSYTAPVKNGYRFAGWYEDAEFTRAIGTNVTSGAAYAKFVEADVMKINAQILAGTTADSESTSMRLLSTVDSLNYQKVGFRLYIEEGQVKEFSSGTVYTEIIANAGGVTIDYKPSDISAASRYFTTYTIEEIPNSAFDTEIYVSVFWVTLDGTEVQSNFFVATVRAGISANNQ